MEEAATPECPRCRELEKIIADLQARLEKLERESKRQAAPFRKPKKLNPKRPGRKSGEDYGQHRRRETPTQIDESYDVPLPEACPDCGGHKLEQITTVTQYQIEIPQTVIHREFTIATGACKQCGAAVQGRHELQTSDATGAAGVQFGPNVHAAIAIANKELGLSHGKVVKLFRNLFGLDIGRSTSCRSVLRTGTRLDSVYQAIRQDVRGSPQVVADETGWRVNGTSAWLHDFVGLTETCYVIDPTRSLNPALELLGHDWSGVLVHDGWSPYDKFAQANHQQCLAHLLRRADSLIEQACGRALVFPREIKRLLLEGLKVRDRACSDQISWQGAAIVAGRLTNQLRRLTETIKPDRQQERFAKFLNNHLDSIFTFLKIPGTDATNWRGEQAIRPAVVNRKVWGGNRTWVGAIAQQNIASVIQTCTQRCADAFSFIKQSLCRPTPLPPAPV